MLIKEHVYVGRPTTLRGIAESGATVTNGGRLTCQGEIRDMLKIEPGGFAIVSGVVSGDIVNDGRLEVRGVVKGTISGEGIQRLRPGSMVNGIRN
ncbi:hypothetical protein [Qipengyuania sp.]|uniref:hypothetical protein n=1 Tax=Qipengyuania sp. TaxID=2004515 RepID=UPI0035C84F3D